MPAAPRPQLEVVDALVGGVVRLESTPGKGTRVTVELPARPREKPGEAVHMLADLSGTPEVLGE